MSTNINIMRFLSIIAIISLILSYVIHLNMELGFCVFNIPWISNNFLFTILSGAFASVVIALLMEARQYTINKDNPTYNSYYSKQVIDKLLDDIIPIFNELTVCVQKIAKTKKRQEQFDNLYKKLTRYDDGNNTPSLEKFLGL